MIDSYILIEQNHPSHQSCKMLERDLECRSLQKRYDIERKRGDAWKKITMLFKVACFLALCIQLQELVEE